MSAMRRCGGCGYISKGDDTESVLQCPVCEQPLGKLRLLPEVGDEPEHEHDHSGHTHGEEA